ncbi:MAG: dTDP-glucose 4,6-dehydratase [Candidatus Eiseniibacteriota bacterium]
MAEPRDLSRARVLVTGGAGFIGSHFVHHLLRRHPDCHVVVLDALTYAGRRENLDGLPARALTFIHGDIRDPAAVALAMAGCDLVLNFAAESHVDRSIEAPGEFIQTDIYGVFVLCEEARRQRVQRFLQVSTDEVYGEVLEGHATEEWPLKPRSPYAASKAGGDRLAYAYWATHGLPIIVTRCANNYGPRQYPEKLVPLFATNAIDDQPLPVYGTGLNRRDWLHVEDHCAALVTLLRHPGIEGETFNIGGGKELDVLTVTGAILRLLGKPATLIRHVEDRPGHDRRYALDCDKLRRLTGWARRIAFEEGLRETVDWYRSHEGWWRPIKEGEFRAYYERMYGQRRVLKEVRP